MKIKTIFSICMIFFCAVSNAQLIQASLGAGAEANRVKIYLRPSVTQNANISTLQFNLGVSTSLMPKPNITVLSTAFPGVTWFVSEATEGGYYNFQLTTATSPITFSAVANTEFEALEVSFSGGPVTASDVALVTLPDGGNGPSQQNSLFLSTGSLQSSGTNLYYTRPGVTVDNNFSYDEINFTPGSTTSTAIISGVILPVTFTNLSVLREGKNALITWQVANQVNNSHYEVEYSLDGRSFTQLGRVSSTTADEYEYRHLQIDKYTVPAIFYRVKQVDLDGSSEYSVVRKLQINGKALTLTMGENPVKGSTVRAFINSTTAGRGTVMVTDLSGKTVYSKPTSWSAGNTNINIEMSYFSSGSYILWLVNGEERLQIKFVK